MASLCKGSSFAEYGAGLQHTNKQQHMVLQKKVAFAEKQAEQTKSSTKINQKLLLMKMKSNLDRSIVADERIAKMRAGKAGLESQASAQRVDCAKSLANPRNKNDPLTWLQPTRVISTHSALPLEVALPAAIMLLRSQGRDVDPALLGALRQFERPPGFLRRAAMANDPQKNEPKDDSKPAGNNKRSRASSESSSSSASTAIPLKEEKLCTQRVLTDIDFPGPSPVVRPSSAPGTAVDLEDEKEFATAIWVASQGGNEKVAGSASSKCRPASARPNFADHQKTEKAESNRDCCESVAIEPVPTEVEETDGVVRFETPPGSPDLSEPRVCDNGLSSKHLDELQRKLSDPEPQISLIDLHRAAVAAKDYPGRIKRFIRSILKYKSAFASVSVDYYSQRALEKSREIAGARVDSKVVPLQE